MWVSTLASLGSCDHRIRIGDEKGCADITCFSTLRRNLHEAGIRGKVEGRYEILHAHHRECDADFGGREYLTRRVQIEERADDDKFTSIEEEKERRIE